MGILRKAICARTARAVNRFYFQNQCNVNGIRVASETNVEDNSSLHAAKSKLSGKISRTTMRNYAAAVESNKFTYNRTMGGTPMIQQIQLHHASNVRFYSSSSRSAATTKTQPKEKSYPTVLWHLHEGIEEIMADYVQHEMTRAWILFFFRLSLTLIAKDVFLSLVF